MWYRRSCNFWKLLTLTRFGSSSSFHCSFFFTFFTFPASYSSSQSSWLRSPSQWFLREYKSVLSSSPYKTQKFVLIYVSDKFWSTYTRNKNVFLYYFYIIPLLLKLRHVYRIYFSILPGFFNCDCHFFELFYNYYHVFDNFNYSSTKVFLHLSYGAYKSCLRLFWQGKTFEVPLLPAKITIR